MRVQALRPQLAVERLDEAIVGRLPRSREVQGDVVGVGPKVQVARDKLVAVVGPDRPGIAGLLAGAFSVWTTSSPRKVNLASVAGQ